MNKTPNADSERSYRSLRTWRHADGTVRVDHMDARPGDYYGAQIDGSGGAA